MGTVAVRLVIACLAPAQIVHTVAFGNEAHWLDTGVLMGAIAERLRFGTATAAIEVGFAFFEFD